MNLYLLTRNDPLSYDEFDKIVVCAESPEKALMIHPRSSYGYDWCYRYRVGVWDGFDDDGTWIDADSPNLEVKHIGKAAKGMVPGIVLASFNAG